MVLSHQTPVWRSKLPLRALWIAALSLACAPHVLHAQPPKIKLVEPPGPLLPAQLEGFTKVTPAPVGDGLNQIDPREAAILKEDGVQRFERSEYASGSIRGAITAYQFVDASGAYSAFCFARGAAPSVSGKHLGDAEALGSEGTIFRSGANLVVAKFDSSAASTRSLLEDLSGRLPKVAGPAGQPPLLPTYLPEKGLIPGSIRYALGGSSYAAMGGVLPAKILAFDKNAETVTAEYQPHGNHAAKGILTILLYPTPAIAGEQERAIAAQIKTQPLPGEPRLRREGPMLLLASGGFSAAEAQRLVDEIHLRNELTWNKDMPPEFHAEIKKTASLLTSILVFSGVAGLAAILLGLFLGGARAGIRVLMGKPAASEPEFLRIDLSGGPAVRPGDSNPDRSTGQPK